MPSRVRSIGRTNTSPASERERLKTRTLLHPYGTGGGSQPLSAPAPQLPSRVWKYTSAQALCMPMGSPYAGGVSSLPTVHLRQVSSWASQFSFASSA